MTNVEKYTGYTISDIKSRSGIYTITNTINNKIYVGYTKCFYLRFRSHIVRLLNNNHVNYRLQIDSNKYGLDSLKFEILEEYPDYLLPSMEHYWATTLSTSNELYGYNIRPTHPEGYNGHSEETRNKISISHKGKCLSAIDRLKRLKYLYGNKEVLMFSNNSKLIGRYASYIIAAEIHKLCKSRLKVVLDEGSLIYKEYRILYADSEIIDMTTLKRKLVGRYDENMNIIDIYNTTLEACERSNISYGHIADCCRNGGKVTKSGLFKYISTVKLKGDELIYN